MTHTCVKCTPEWSRSTATGTLLVLCLLSLCAAFLTSNAWAQKPGGDRFGLRIGVWPQPSFEGSLGQLIVSEEAELVTYDVRVSEPSFAAPFLEFYGLFHLKGAWWIEGSVGWSGRWDVQVRGVPAPPRDSILLGEGWVVVIPIFAGLRARHTLGSRSKPHTVYGRAGLSLIFANESPDVTSPLTDRVYSPGSEGAPGFLLGTGGEFYFSRRFALTADANYRYSKFSYGADADFDVSGIWVSLGVQLSTR